jgi:MFS family permease
MVAISIALSFLLALKLVEVWHLFAFSLLAGVSAVFDRTLRSTLVFHSVPRAEAGNAVALNSIAFSVSRAVGPSVAGFLIGAVGAAWNFGIQALLYMGVVAAALSVQAGRAPSAVKKQSSAWAEMKEGFRFVASDPVARMMVVLGLVPPLLLIPSIGALMPVFAADVFKSGPEGLGLMLSAVGVGGIIGGLVAAWTARYDHAGLVQMLALAVFAFSLIAFAVSSNVAIAVLFLALAGIAEMVHHTVHVTTLQMCAPEHLRGRIASLLPIFPAFISVGALVAGVLADLLGPEMVVIILAGIALGVIIAAWARSQAVRELRMSSLIAGDTLTK